MNEGMYNYALLQLMNELKDYPFFYKLDNFIRFQVPKENEVFDGKMVLAVLDLVKLGGAKILNEKEYRFMNTEFNDYEYEFHLVINHSSFEGIYEQCVRNVTKLSLGEYQKQLENENNFVPLKRKLNEVIRIKNIKLGEKKFLDTLSDFKQHEISELKHIVKSVSSMRVRLNKKLKNTGFEIKTKRSEESVYRKSGLWWLDYQLPKIKR